MIDKDYLDYLRAMGEETNDPKYLWMYLSAITEYIYQIEEGDKTEQKPVNLMGQYKIQPQSGGGMRKGPPPIIV